MKQIKETKQVSLVYLREKQLSSQTTQHDILFIPREREDKEGMKYAKLREMKERIQLSLMYLREALVNWRKKAILQIHIKGEKTGNETKK